MLMKPNAVLWTLLLLSLATTSSAQLPDLTKQTFQDYQAAIEADVAETAFLKINWYSQLHRAVKEAHQREKPLLIYVMNGHPLACT